MKQTARKEIEKTTKKVTEKEQIDQLAEKISEVQIEELPDDEILVLGKLPEKPKSSEVVEKKPVVEKPKKKSIPTPKIEPLMPSTETPEEIVSYFRNQHIILALNFGFLFKFVTSFLTNKISQNIRNLSPHIRLNIVWFLIKMLLGCGVLISYFYHLDEWWESLN